MIWKEFTVAVYFLQAIIAFGKLSLQHICVFRTDMVKIITAGGNIDHFLILIEIKVLIQKGKLKLNGRIEII